MEKSIIEILKSLKANPPISEKDLFSKYSTNDLKAFLDELDSKYLELEEDLLNTRITIIDILQDRDKS